MTPARRRKLIYVVTVSVLLAGAALALTLIAPRHDPVAAADALREAGRYDEALDRYQDALARDPNNAPALWGVAQTHLARHDTPQALEYLNRYLERAPQGQHAAEARAAQERLRGSFAAARTPSPELVPPPTAALAPAPGASVADQWQQALDLEGRGDLLSAIAVYAGLAQAAPDGRLRAACYERIARCEARRPPFDYPRIQHFYLEAARAYRQLNDLQNSARCQELAYLAQEYTRVEGARRKLAEEARAVEAKRGKPEEKPPPPPQETLAAAQEAFRTGNEAKALAEGSKIADAVPEANYILGMVHLHQGLWDDAREELERYLKEAPKGASAEEARTQLAAIKGKRLLFMDRFTSGADKWELTGGAPGARPATEALLGAQPSEGPCLKIEPGTSVYTSFGEGRIATVEIRLYDPPSEAASLPPISVRLYAQNAYACAPLLITRRGYRFASQATPSVPRTPGWHRLVIDVSDEVVTAQLDGRPIGEIRREGGFSGLSLQAERATGAGALYVNEVRVVGHP